MNDAQIQLKSLNVLACRARGAKLSYTRTPAHMGNGWGSTASREHNQRLSCHSCVTSASQVRHAQRRQKRFFSNLNTEITGMRWTPRGYGGKCRTTDVVKRQGWRELGVLAVAVDDERLSWPERELISQLGDKLYGRRRLGKDRS